MEHLAVIPDAVTFIILFIDLLRSTDCCSPLVNVNVGWLIGAVRHKQTMAMNHAQGGTAVNFARLNVSS